LQGTAADDLWGATGNLWLGGPWWFRSVEHDAGLPSLDNACPEPGGFWIVNRRARKDLLRFVGGIIAALSLMLVLVLAALSRRINATNLVLLLIAACQRFGHRDEPGDGDSLRVRRYLSLPGTVPAM
jgi:hypothetical protein